jgi:hypothetical protein
VPIAGEPTRAIVGVFVGPPGKDWALGCIGSTHAPLPCGMLPSIDNCLPPRAPRIDIVGVVIDKPIANSSSGGSGSFRSFGGLLLVVVKVGAFVACTRRHVVVGPFSSILEFEKPT